MRFSQKKVMSGAYVPNEVDGYIRDNLISFFSSGVVADMGIYDKLREIITVNGFKTIDEIREKFFEKFDNRDPGDFIRYTERYLQNKAAFEKKYASFIPNIGSDKIAKMLGVDYF